MPRFRSFRRGFRGGSRGRSKPRWIAQSAEGVVPANNVFGGLLLDAATAQLVDGLQGKSTVRRIRGRIHVLQDANAAVHQNIGLGIIRATTNEPTPVLGGFGDPLVATELGERDWLWTGNLTFHSNAFNFGQHFKVYELDIRTKRKLEDNDSLRLYLTNPAGGAQVTVEIDIRILITIYI